MYIYVYIYIDVFMHIMCLKWICYSFDSLQVTVMAVTHHYYREIGFPLHTFAHHRGAHVRLKQGNLEGTTIILCPRSWHSMTVTVRYSIIGGWSHVEGTSFEMMWRMLMFSRACSCRNLICATLLKLKVFTIPSGALADCEQAMHCQNRI